MIDRRSFTTRVSLALALLLLAYGAFIGLLGRYVAAEHEHESLQRFSHGLARHIVEHWLAVTLPNPDDAERAARVALLSMLMVVNPAIQVYVLDGQARDQVAGQLSLKRVWQGATFALVMGLAATFLLGAYALRRLTRPLHRLAARMSAYNNLTAASAPINGDEIDAISAAFDAMQTRIEAQTMREREQMSAHREMMASVAHDLRTPLTALHGQLEALAGNTITQSGTRARFHRRACTE